MAKISFVQSGKNSKSHKLLLPEYVINYLNITEDDRDVKLMLKDGCLIVKKEC